MYDAMILLFDQSSLILSHHVHLLTKNGKLLRDFITPNCALQIEKQQKELAETLFLEFFQPTVRHQASYNSFSHFFIIKIR